MLVSRTRIFDMDALHEKASQSTKRLHAGEAAMRHAAFIRARDKTESH